jgi:lipoyl synthase
MLLTAMSLLPEEVYAVNKTDRLPRWLKVPFPKGENYSMVKNLISEHSLNTICTSGNCPNKGECWSAGTASFMILGEKCTRDCNFCAVKTARPDAPDLDEPRRLAETIYMLRLKHCVITSVARDDLPDGGAEFWATTIRKIKEFNPSTSIEVLIPDFNGKTEHLQFVINEKPDIISHNIETVWRLTPRLRSMAKYSRSLEVLSFLSASGTRVKSGLMVGHGETEEEVYRTLDDLRKAGVTIVTIGQYLQPTGRHLPVKEYVHPEVFEKYRLAAIAKGFRHAECGPLVRSSYHAERHVDR